MNTEEHKGPGTAHAESINSNRRGDIWVHSDVSGNFNLDIGHLAVRTLIHEMGHALGLQHPGDYDASDGPSNYEDDAIYAQDSRAYTVMSYFGAGNTGGSQPSAAQTPLLHDIYAIQRMYGANLATRADDTTYGFNSNTDNAVFDFTYNVEPALAIWDAAGTDTLDLSGDPGGVDIDLSPGSFSSALGGIANIAIAFGAWIENATGGEGDDVIWGNELANELRGRNGADSLYGALAADTLIGNRGDDFLYGDAANDLVMGGLGDDTLYGGIGWDELDGGGGVDTAVFTHNNANWFIDLAPDEGGPGTATDGNETDVLIAIENVTRALGNDIIHGSSASNILIGGFGNDRLYGYEGNDTLDGGWGDDILYRGSGNNRIIGGPGFDELRFLGATTGVAVDLHNTFSGQIVVDWPSPAPDEADRISGIEKVSGTIYADVLKGATTVDNTIEGNAGNDEIWGRGGTNLLVGGYGDDTFVSGSGQDTFDGGSGFDTANYQIAGSAVTLALGVASAQNIPGLGSDTFISIENAIGSEFGDTIYGTSGYNHLQGAGGNDYIDASSGPDRIDGAAGRDTLRGGPGGDTIYGGTDNDTLIGERDDDILHGNQGDDVIDGGHGDDELWGGVGLDTASYQSAPAAVSVDLNIVSDPQNTRSAGFDRLNSIEAVQGSPYNDNLKAADAGSRVFGNDGHDNITGRSGNDWLIGAAGNDVIWDEGGNDRIDGGNGVDSIGYRYAAAGVVIDLKLTDQNTVGAGYDTLLNLENLIGSNQNDTLMGSDTLNTIIGLDGADWIFGRGQNDDLQGNEGNDVIDGGHGNDRIDGGNGLDSASYVTSLAAVQVDLGIQGWQYTGWTEWDYLTNIENLVGSVFDDILRGDANNNVIRAGAGNDTVEGRDGNDVLVGSVGGDHLDGGLGTDRAAYDLAAAPLRADLLVPSVNTGEAAGDTYVSIENLQGSTFDDELRGDTANNVIYGGAGNDVIHGRAGNDILQGQLGDDLLFDGPGDDVFVFSGSFGSDTIIGFETSTSADLIDLSSTTFANDFADLSANHLTQVGANAVIDDLAGNTITLAGVAMGILSNDDFSFG